MTQTTAMSAADLNAFFDRDFPELIHEGARVVVVEEVGPMTGRLRLLHHDRHLRPGGTVSGPSMFLLADVALYATILAQVGPVGLVGDDQHDDQFPAQAGRAAT